MIEPDFSFELYLDNAGVTYQEENQRYKDDFSTKFSFPFEFHLDRDLRMFLGDFGTISNISKKTVFENCYHISDGRITRSKLEILGSEGEVIKAQIDSGFEEFPNWQKPIRDLPLGIVLSPLIDAPTKIDKTWPAVQWNYPMVHSDVYEGAAMFEDFEGTLNKRVGGDFVTNVPVTGENIYHNYNIVIPMPYWLHILKTGFEDAGFSLHGDVMNDERLKKTLIVPSKKIEIFDRPGAIEWFVGAESIVESPAANINIYEDEQPIDLVGFFLAEGVVRVINRIGWLAIEIPFELRPKVWLNDTLLWQTSNQYGEYPISFVFYTDPNVENKLKFKTMSMDLGANFALELKITPLTLYDENMEPINSLANLSNFNIAEYLPDKTFGEFVTATKNLVNLQMDLRNGNEVWMNYIDNAFNDKSLIDISDYEVKSPEVVYDQNVSFLLSYHEVEHEDYNFLQVFYDKHGMKTLDFKDDDETNRIEIPVLPLPMLMRNDIYASHQFEAMDVFQMVIYDGLNGGENTPDDITEWRMDVVFNAYWQRWLKFRVNASTLRWTFYVLKNKWRHIKILNNLYAYSQKLWIRNLSKTSLNEKVYEIEIEADIVKN